MKTARTSDMVIWWRMGATCRARQGEEKAREMAGQIITEGNRRLFLDGVEGKPKPRVRPRQEGAR